MSRQIDLTRALSDEDRAYLEMRGDHARVEQMDRDFPPGEELDEEDEEVEDYAEWNKAELVTELKHRELDSNGRVEELRERLMLNDAEGD